MTAWSTVFLEWLIDYYLVTAVLLIVVGIAMAIVRQPARRLALAWGTLVGLFALAILCAMPLWPRFYLPIDSAVTITLGSTERSDVPNMFSEVDHNESPATGATGVDNSDLIAPHQATGASLQSQINIRTLATCVFLCGSSMIAGWLVIGAVLTVRLRHGSRRAPAPVQAELARLLGEQLPATEVLLSGHVDQALAVGVLEPQIILPERFLGQESCEALEAALAHEAAHVRNGDLRMLACMRLLMLVLFAHPLYWWLRSRVRIDQELLADAVAGQTSDVAAYAEILLDWFRTNASNRSKILTASLGLWEGPHLLKRRISMLLNEEFRVEIQSPVAWRVSSWLLLTSTALLLSFVTLRDSSTAVANDDDRTPTQPAATAEDNPTATARADKQSTKDSIPTPDNQSQEDSTAPPDNQSQGDSKAQAQPAEDSKYQTVDQAWRAGVGYYNAGKFAASRKPFEAALKLAPDDKYRIKVYETLRPVYRQLPKPNKMMEACDFIIRHSDFEPKRSITRSDLLSFMHQRGKVDKLINFYASALKKDPNDFTALYVLSETYDRIKRDPKRAAELTKRLLALNGGDKPVDVRTTAKLAMQLVRLKKYEEGAELYEKIAPLDKRLAAWHWKEAATAWIKVNNVVKALAAAEKSAASSPESRSQQLEHYWHRHLGEVFLRSGESAKAISHLKKAIDNTTIEGYINDCRRLIEQAEASEKVRATN